MEKQIKEKEIDKKEDKKDIEELRRKSQEYADSVGIKLNPKKEIVDNVLKGLLMKKQKYGKLYCPCRVVTGNKEKDGVSRGKVAI